MVRFVFFFTRIVFPAWLTTLALCSRDYNPFSDLSNAQAHVLSWSFSGSGTVPAYSTGTLVIGVALREDVDSFSIHAPGNRFWTDTTVRRISGGVIDAAAFSFSISFFDTGAQAVTVNTWRTGGERVTETLPVRVTFPLRQYDVTGYFGDSLLLSTPPVPDRDAIYKWEFGPGRAVTSARDTARACLIGGRAFGPGTLRVTDVGGNHATPACAFSYALYDTSRPIILCANANLQGDTLVTRDSVLVLKAYIADYGDMTVDSCSVNGSGFDIATPKTNMYYKLFRNMTGHTRALAPLEIRVFALDNRGPDRWSARTFWAVYDPAGPSTPGAHIAYIVPSKDSLTTATRDFRIFGTAENFLGDSMTLAVTVNDSPSAVRHTIYGPGGYWEWPVYLGAYVNTITVTAFGAGNRNLSSEPVTVIYDPTMQDRVKPLIWDILTDGTPAGNLYTDKAVVTLQVRAFDEGSGIQTLTIDNTAVAPDSTGYTWHSDVPLVHSLSGTAVIVRADDHNQNYRDTTVTLFRNTRPVLVSGPAIPAALCADSVYAFSISCFDADSDTVSVVPVMKPRTMTVSRDGAISWTPGAADIGTDTLEVRLYDGYQYSAPIVWTLTCVQCSNPVVPVKFTTKAGDFPAFLQAERDTLRILLATDSTTAGRTDLRYSALFMDRAQSITANDTSAMLVWAPQASDTGLRKLLVTVGNGTMNFDTISPVIRVVPRNQYPCSLSYTFTGTTTSGGKLDLFTSQGPETLLFVIHDQDDPLTERYTVTVSQHAVNSTEILNRKDFIIVIRPDTTRVLDTIFVGVGDMTGTTVTRAFFVRYSIPSPYPSWQHSRSLALNTTASGADVAGNVTGFPVLIRLTNSNFTFGQAQKNGGDIRFAKQDGVPCPYEIERWDSVQGAAEVWVRVDTVYGNDSAATLMMYWGNASAADGSNSSAVFDTLQSAYAGVWHMQESAAGTIPDATAFRRDGVKNGAILPVKTTGALIGTAMKFSGLNGWINLGANQSFVNNVSQITLSVWIRTDTLKDAGIIGFSINGGTAGVSRTALEIGATGYLDCIARAPDNMATAQRLTSSQAQQPNTDYLVTAVIRFDLNQIDLYINGLPVAGTGTIAFGLPQTDNTNSTSSVIGSGEEGYNPAIAFSGLIDEAVVARTARSADWIKLCYMNQKALDALVVFR